MEKKLETVEKKLEMQRKTLTDKEGQISYLDNRLIKSFEKTLGKKVETLENIVKVNEVQFKCDNCTFSTNSETGLKHIHLRNIKL